MRYKLEGNWKKGLAFDLHTLASTYLGPDQYGHDRYDNTRSEIDELVYQLKYRNNKTVVPQIISLLSAIKGYEKFDVIIPVPSSKARPVQPVDAIAQALGQRYGVPTLSGYLTKEGGPQLKSINDPEERVAILEHNISISGKDDLSGKKVLLLDDLYRSGSTLNACCNILKKQANVGDICVLTMTKTRKNR